MLINPQKKLNKLHGKISGTKYYVRTNRFGTVFISRCPDRSNVVPTEKQLAARQKFIEKYCNSNPRK